MTTSQAMTTRKVRSLTNKDKARAKEPAVITSLVITGVVRMPEFSLPEETMPTLLLCPLAMIKLKMSLELIEKVIRFKKVPTSRKSENGKVMSGKKLLNTVYLAKMKQF
jgi:hypothetical protein